jgi:hypothetical protein
MKNVQGIDGGAAFNASGLPNNTTSNPNFDIYNEYGDPVSNTSSSSAAGQAAGFQNMDYNGTVHWYGNQADQQTLIDAANDFKNATPANVEGAAVSFLLQAWRHIGSFHPFDVIASDLGYPNINAPREDAGVSQMFPQEIDNSQVSSQVGYADPITIYSESGGTWSATLMDLFINGSPAGGNSSTVSGTIGDEQISGSIQGHGVPFGGQFQPAQSIECEIVNMTTGQVVGGGNSTSLDQTISATIGGTDPNLCQYALAVSLPAMSAYQITGGELVSVFHHTNPQFSGASPLFHNHLG